jgi:hypothetical protein
MITLHICLTGPPGHTGWRNRFLDSLNVYKYGLWAKKDICTVPNYLPPLPPPGGCKIPEYTSGSVRVHVGGEGWGI